MNRGRHRRNSHRNLSSGTELLTFYTIAHCIKDTVEDVLISLCSYYLGETVELQVYLC